MEQYIIKGGNPLAGEVEISGAKNAALGILAAAIMTDETVLIENLPDVRDINVLLEAMESIGVKVERITRHAVMMNSAQIGDVSVDYEYIKRIRASYYLIGALLGKYKKAVVPLPGGCNIGSRPIDLHIKGFKALGAKVEIRNGFIFANAEHLHGSHIFLDTVSVGATINIMMAASMAEGYTIIENCAREPHVVDVANFLNSMGANIKGAGTDVIRIRGVQKFHNGIDLASPSGTAIYAAYDGKVVAASYSSSMGNYVMIDHGGSLYTIYMHASKLYVSTGDVVVRGETIAAVGSTGRSTGPHLHFGVRLNGEYVSPWNYLKQ